VRVDSRAAVPLAVLAAALVVAGACGGSGAAGPSSSGATQPTVSFSTAHFRILTDRADRSVLQAVADALEASYPRVTTDMRTGDIPITDALVWQDQTACYADMQANLGRVFQGSTGWVRGGHAISVLVVANTPRNAVHEFCHVVSIAVNPAIANNPRWLWETVALYENNEFVDPATLDFMRSGRFPTLAALDADYSTSQQVYQVGCVLGEFIVSTWGMDALLALIRANGSLEVALQLSPEAFEQRWYTWLRARYLS
jgi:hypothetical protein